MELHGKKAVVTGGSNGIGFALASLLASNGARVTNLDQTAPAETMAGVTHLHCDVSRLDDVRAALAQTGGAIDLLVLNAGVIRRGPVLAHPDGEFDLLFGVNAKGTWLMLKEAVPLLSQGGTVVHVSSYRAAQDVNDPGLYAASKAAGEHLARCAAAGDPGFALKIARLGPTDTAIARHGIEGDALKKKETIMRSTDEVALMLMELATGTHATLAYDPGADTYAFGT
jgi:3-oxoacyl-[acyl-carrier protein] reductase